jgi:hypothetical protein
VCPLAQSIWDLTPQVVPEGMDYTLALLVQAAEHNWPLQDLCDLGVAFHAKHGRRPMALRHYQELICTAIEYTFAGARIGPAGVLVG